MNILKSKQLTRIGFGLWHLLALMLLLFIAAGCEKDTKNHLEAERGDFTGSWQGELVSYSYGQKVVQKYEWMVFTDPVSGQLSGLLTMYETNRLEELQFSDGVWYFRVVNSDSLNPECREWSFSGYAKFIEEGVISFNLAGNKCGPIGDQFVEWGGTMQKVSDGLDPDNHFSFINPGNGWQYAITKVNDDTCSMGYQIEDHPETGIYTGTMSNGCGWNWTEKHFSWQVDPGRFSVLPDPANKIPLTVFTLDMATEKLYTFKNGVEVSITSLLKRHELVEVPAGQFICNKYQVETAAEGDGMGAVMVSYYWIDNRYGIIKREVLNPPDSNAIKTQLLVSKNF